MQESAAAQWDAALSTVSSVSQHITAGAGTVSLLAITSHTADTCACRRVGVGQSRQSHVAMDVLSQVTDGTHAALLQLREHTACNLQVYKTFCLFIIRFVCENNYTD